MDTLEAYEDTVEGRVIAYFDFMYSTAYNYLIKYHHAYGFDVEMEAQDLVQDAVRRILESDAYGLTLGAGYFRTVITNACADFIKGKRSEAMKHNNIGLQATHIERTERAGWIALTEAVRALPEPERLAVAERYLGYRQGELSGSQSRSSHALKRARKKLAGVI